jgi:hypothetical protein
MAKSTAERVQKHRRTKRQRALLPKMLISSSAASDLLPEIDPDTNWALGRIEVQRLLASDRGGFDLCGEGEKLLIRRASTLEMELRLIEKKLGREEQGDKRVILVERYQRLTSTQRRLLECLGTRRMPRTVDAEQNVILDHDQLQAEMNRRAVVSDNLLATLWKDQKREESSGEPKLVVIYEGNEQ